MIFHIAFLSNNTFLKLYFRLQLNLNWIITRSLRLCVSSVLLLLLLAISLQVTSFTESFSVQYAIWMAGRLLLSTTTVIAILTHAIRVVLSVCMWTCIYLLEVLSLLPPLLDDESKLWNTWLVSLLPHNV